MARESVDHYDWGGWRPQSEPGHTPGCWSRVVVNTQTGENAAWIAQCAPGCPRLEASIERGRELVEEHGW